MLGLPTRKGAQMVTKDYERDQITVHWDSSRCIHTAICLRTLPEVFDVHRRPWIDVDAATPNAVADAVTRCPTGALRFTSDAFDEARPATTELRPIRGGPMVVRGDVELIDGDGNTIAHETRVTLCRCGNSRNQPFCDNSHRSVGFDEPEIRAPDTAQAPDEVCPPQPGFNAD